jgi:hypothetical protein
MRATVPLLEHSAPFFADGRAGEVIVPAGGANAKATVEGHGRGAVQILARRRRVKR